eukprot:15883466-Heterocapsa_arctica.AAC.1
MTRGEATVKKIEAHWKLFKQLWSAFERISFPAIERGASIFIEWSRGCNYWKEAKVGLVAKYGPQAGLPIKKPWM